MADDAGARADPDCEVVVSTRMGTRFESTAVLADLSTGALGGGELLGGGCTRAGGAVSFVGGDVAGAWGGDAAAGGVDEPGAGLAGGRVGAGGLVGELAGVCCVDAVEIGAGRLGGELVAKMGAGAAGVMGDACLSSSQRATIRLPTA